MNLKPLTENVLYALIAQWAGEVRPKGAFVMDARRGPVFVLVP